MNRDGIDHWEGPEAIPPSAIEPWRHGRWERRREKQNEKPKHPETRRSRLPSPQRLQSESGSQVPTTINGPVGGRRTDVGVRSTCATGTGNKIGNKHHRRQEQHLYHRQRRHEPSGGRSSGFGHINNKHNPMTSRKILICIVTFAFVVYAMIVATVYRAFLDELYKQEDDVQDVHNPHHGMGLGWPTKSMFASKIDKQRSVLNRNQEEKFQRSKRLADMLSARRHGHGLDREPQQAQDDWNEHDVEDGSSPHLLPQIRRHLPTSRKTVTFKRKYPRLIYFLHIHKSAGTFVCNQAFANRMSANYQKNCNVQADQRCCDPKGNFSASSQISFARRAAYDLVASEKELPEVLVPDYYDYVVSLRDSRERYESHWKHLIRNAKERERQNERRQDKHSQGAFNFLWSRQPHKKKTVVEYPKGGDASGRWRLNKMIDYDPNDPNHYRFFVKSPKDSKFHPVGNYTKWILGQPDNYNLRMICGAKCLAVPKFQITRDIFEYTLKRLWTDFSHILFVEDMEKSFGIFAEAYGWTNRSNTISNSTMAKDSHSKPKKDSSPKLPKWWDPYMSVLDNALYEFAKRKHRLGIAARNNISADKTHYNSSRIMRPVWNEDYEPFKNQALVDDYFREGPLRNCANSCCGYCTKW
eukprot:jgi/Psemu1/4577/gm1.4577_g